MTEEEAKKNAEKNLGNISECIEPSNLAEGIIYQQGKVRENYITPYGNRILLTTDRVSVYDSIVGTIPFKGQILDEITHWWFEKTKTLSKNHVISRPSPVITVAKQCNPLKIEMVVRAYLTGTTTTSIWTEYKNGKREFSGNQLPEGMRKNEKLPYVMITPTTKGDYGKHDEPISPKDIAERNLLHGSKMEQEHLWLSLCNQSLALFGMGSALADSAGLILVDTKYEFGLTNEGEVILIDEIHTADSSRYWEKQDYGERFARGEEPMSLSKQFVRDAIINQGYDPEKDHEVPMLSDESRIECAARYIMLCQRITGKPFIPDTRPAEEKIYKPLKELGVLKW